MGSFVEVGRTGEFKDGSKKKMAAQGREIILARVGDSYYAADNRCPHMGGDLSAGNLEGTMVTCPRHGYQFDLRNGQLVRGLTVPGATFKKGEVPKSSMALRTYNVKVEGDTIFIEI